MEQNTVFILQCVTVIRAPSNMKSGIFQSLFRNNFFLPVFFFVSNFFCIAISAKEVHFSPSLTITENQQSKTLNLTGTAVRSVMFFKVYSLAHYTSDLSLVSHKEPDIFNQIIDAKTTKQISIVFRRNLKASQIRKRLSRGVKDNCVDNEFKQVQSDLDLFKQVINHNVKKNDEFALRWLTGGTLVMFFNGEQVGKLESPLLARLLWSVWFGADAVVDRSDLVQMLVNTPIES